MITAAARWTSGAKVAAARGSSWFSRKRARWSWKSSPAMQVLANRARRAVLEAVVEPLVVGVVEPLLLERPLEVPVDLGQEQESRDLRADGRRGARPERRRRDPPRPLEDLGQHQHRHVAAHAVALARDPPKLAEQRVLQRRVPVVQLQRVGPAGEVRVAAVGQDAASAGRLEAAVVLRFAPRAAPRSRR